MRFAIVAATFFGAVMAHGHGYGDEQSTVYETEVETITSCPPSVPDCPAATATEVPEETWTSAELPEETWTSAELPEETTLATMPHGNGTDYPTGAPEPECPGYSVKTIETSITTVIPTVIYETVEVPCETEINEPTGTGYIPTSGVASPSTGVPTETPVFTGGAAGMGVSVVAAAAGLIAFLA